MSFEINDWVVYPAFGVGRIVGLVRQSFSEAESQLYYEVTGEQGTVWVQVDNAATPRLRPLTRQDELAEFRRVLRGQPLALSADFRQRRQDLRDRLRRGTLQALCEVVRDLSGRAWHKPLSESETESLRNSVDAVCREWAAANRVSLEQASTEVNELLLEARRASAI
jgi:CarD family transcriptional regulator